jgi:hypothetical protein
MRFALLPSNAARAAVLACLVCVPGTAAACAYHGALANNLALHPGAYDVATALQAAEDAGTIAPLSATTLQVSMVAFHQTVKRIEQFRNLLDPARAGAAPAFSLLLIDSGMWSRLTPGAEGMTLDVHTTAPGPNEPVVLTVASVLRAVLDGQLSTADALHRGLIRVEAGIDAKLKLFDLIATAATASARPAGVAVRP